ncbi:MAG: hypothetical protein QM619_04875 [Micropruina sp.]|uniref:DUF7507 domain-containing protein n=1 Tax=Micropruina sp. TaxID=2737536 RepID=UPI0039E61683
MDCPRCLNCTRPRAKHYGRDRLDDDAVLYAAAITHAGQVITYTFTIGNATIADARPVEGVFTGTGALTAVSCPPAAERLTPGESEVCSAQYTVTDADLRGGAGEHRDHDR